MAHIFLFSYCCFFFFFYSASGEKTGMIMHFSVSLWILSSAVLGRLQTVLVKRHSPEVLWFPCTVWNAKENAVRQTAGWGIFLLLPLPPFLCAGFTFFTVLFVLYSTIFYCLQLSHLLCSIRNYQFIMGLNLSPSIYNYVT